MRTDGGVFQFCKVTQNRFLFCADLFWNLKNDPQKQISRPAATRIRHSAAAHSYDFAGLRARVNVVLSLSFEAGDLDVCSERCLRVGNRNVTDEILPLASEERMIGNVDLNVHVTGRSTMLAGFAYVAEYQEHSGVDASRYRGISCDCRRDSAGAAAVAAFVTNDGTFATACRAGGLHSEKALRLNDVSRSTTVVTFVGSCARCCSRSGATLAKFLPLECHRLCAALCRFEQVDADSCFDALALDRSAASTSTSSAAESETFEEVAEDVEDVVDVLKSASTASGPANTFVAKAVVAGSLFFVAENVVGLGRFFETLHGGIVTGISVRVVFDREFFEGLLDFIRRSVARHTQDFIVVAL
jgi:hypothetical protein